MAVLRASPFSSDNFDCQSVRFTSIKHLLGVVSTAAPADLRATCEIISEAGNYRKQFTLPELPWKRGANQGPAQSVHFLILRTPDLASYV